MVVQSIKLMLPLVCLYWSPREAEECLGSRIEKLASKIEGKKEKSKASFCVFLCGLPPEGMAQI